MTRFYQALKQHRRTRSEQVEQGSDVASGDAPKTTTERSSALKRKTPSSLPSLFAADPEENVRLWMQRYFGEVRVSREDAIRHWLSMPADSRVHSFVDMPAKTDTVAEPVVTVLDPTASMPPAGQVFPPNIGVDSSRMPRFIPTSMDGAEAGRPRSWQKLILRVGMYSLVGALLATLLWAIPAKHRATTQANSMTAGNAVTDRERASKSAADASSNEATGVASVKADVAGQPSRIESVSIGCEAAKPCIEVNTSGRQMKPQLSTLSQPDRLVMDFAGADYGAGFRRIAVKRGVVKDVRIRAISDEGPASTRIVVDLSAQSEAALRSEQNKFVLDITPKISSN
jgi:AMIN domain